jgi:hypothetical protein
MEAKLDQAGSVFARQGVVKVGDEAALTAFKVPESPAHVFSSGVVETAAGGSPQGDPNITQWN